MEMIKLTIDGHEVEVGHGSSLLLAACKVDIYIPALCSHPDLPPGGNCGLCMVELAGQEDLIQACETAAAAGMAVYTNTPRVQEHRKEKLAALLGDHPHSCLTCAQQEGCSRTQCSSNVSPDERCCERLGNCELQKVARYIGIKLDTPRYVYRALPVIREEPLISRNYNLCIGCGRCERVCREVRGVDAIRMTEIQGKLVAAPKEASLADSGCRFCTACVAVCPTGALLDKDLARSGKEGLVPCRSSCPAGVDVPRYVRLIAEEKFDQAIGVIREKVIFPGTLGRVCFHPCESNCRRGKIDEPVSICRLKRFVSDSDNRKWQEKQPVSKPTGKQVAVVGAGPAGLTAAYHLARLGHDITVFEALPVAGGMVMVGIPSYRLPKSVLASEIETVEKAGVKIKTGQKIDNVVSLLQEGFAAVFIATGAHGSVRMGVPGEDLPGVLSGISFLRRVNLGEAVPLGERVVVGGGGNVAIDAARTALRLGAKEVHVHYRRTKEKMPAFAEEVEAAESEGVTFHYLSIMKSILGDGKVTGVLVAEVDSFTVENGRFKPTFKEGAEAVIPADNVIVAIGQRPQLGFAAGLTGSETVRLEVDQETLATTVPGIYAGGDAVTGPRSVIEAISAGRRAAVSIDKFLGGDGKIDQSLAEPEEPAKNIGRIEGFSAVKRHGFTGRPWSSGSRMLPCPPGEVLAAKFGEIELTLPEDMAVTEAGRCLRCDLRLSISKPLLPPESWLAFNEENVDKVPGVEGVLQLLDENKMVLAIIGTANLREALEEYLENEKICYFGYEEEPMYTSRESQLIQQFLQEHGRLPEGVGDLDDLF